MGKSYRIKTQLGINKTINVNFEQDFEFMEILSLKIQQSDVYTRDCSEYGVITGRVTANNGLGIPNSRVSVFIPIEAVDKLNPVITSIYPYENVTDKNEDGYRYNLLPYEKSYDTHSPTGTFPSRNDVLTNSTAIEIYEKYYKYTVKTNESGDYMIFGVPIGTHTIFLDVDLSDIGEFSLSPQDLIRMGIATESQVAGSRFKSSNDLNSLPQIISITKNIDVSPLWGDVSVCQIAINRVDFDLRDDANIDIQPTAVFMGAIYSAADKYRIRNNCRPKDDLGNLCGLIPGTGQILSVRHTINQDSNGNPILEQYQLEQSGNVIDGTGSWLTELPMNLDYVYTNEFGQRAISNDPKIGIPTKGKYRFKIKWTQSTSLSEQTRRAYWLVPNIKEYGWNSNGTADPSNSPNPDAREKIRGSYYFGLDWSGYTNQSAAINCEDTFYEFGYNRVYTVAGLIDQWKKGGRGKFIGIKEIDDDTCNNTVNKFPVNDAFRNFDLLFFIFSLLISIFQPIGVALLFIVRLACYLWNRYTELVLGILVGLIALEAAQNYIAGGAALATDPLPKPLLSAMFFFKAAVYTTLDVLILANAKKIKGKILDPKLKVPMITFPDCQMCECSPTVFGVTTENGFAPASGYLTQLSNPTLYSDLLTGIITTREPTIGEDKASIKAIGISKSLAGNLPTATNNNSYKINVSEIITYDDGSHGMFLGNILPPGERVNLFNLREMYFNKTNWVGANASNIPKLKQGENRIKVSFAYKNNISFHYDNTITVLTTQSFDPGTMFTTVNPRNSSDVNYLFSANTTGGTIVGISGVSLIDSGDTISVTYANPNNQLDSTTVEYMLPYGNQDLTNKYPSDIEYFQVVTAMTLNVNTLPSGQKVFTNPGFYSGKGFWGYLNLPMTYYEMYQQNVECSFKGVPSICSGLLAPKILPKPCGYPLSPNFRGAEITNPPILRVDTFRLFDEYIYRNRINLWESFTDFEKQYVTILQRGVDPYSPKYENKFGIGKILGFDNEDDIIITATTRLNIPIQPLPTVVNQSTTLPKHITTVQTHYDKLSIFHKSYFFRRGVPGSTRPGSFFSAFTTSNIGYYSNLDSRLDTTQSTGAYPWFTQFNALIGSAKGVGTPSYPSGSDRFGKGFFGLSQYNASYAAYGQYNNRNEFAVDDKWEIWYPQQGYYSINDIDTHTWTNQGTPPNRVVGGNNNYKNGFYREEWDGTSTPRDCSGGASMYFKSILVSFRGGYQDRIFTVCPPNTGTQTQVCCNYQESCPLQFIPWQQNLNNSIEETCEPQKVLYSKTYKVENLTRTLTSFEIEYNVLRTDRLPSSDYSDAFVDPKVNPDLVGKDFTNNTGLLQQNLGFSIYVIDDDGNINSIGPTFDNGADQSTVDLDGLPGGQNVLDTLGNHDNLVSLNCYQGTNNTFGVIPNCNNTDYVEGGCYVLLNNVDGSLKEGWDTDFRSWAEWGYRFRFFYALCRGVLAQSFVNNWVNGSLFSFPLQVDTFYDSNNKPFSVFCDNLVYFDEKTNNFYYRSSPYFSGSTSNQRFVGSPSSGLINNPTNNKQLLFPTTIINLGLKSKLYKEVSYDPTMSDFFVDKLNPTSYSDTSDLVNLFVISRIADENSLRRLFATSTNNTINQLFSRGNNQTRRVDGDLAQLLSINSEVGKVAFSPQFYTVGTGTNEPVILRGFPGDQPLMGVFFSSTTEDLQLRDYLTPGLINFRPIPNQNAITYPLGVKNQIVPFYQWQTLAAPAPNISIFGSEKNNWLTNSQGIFSRGYQDLDRRTLFPYPLGSSSYFIGSNTQVNDIRARGYIFNVDNSGLYSDTFGTYPTKFHVGAPFHFYFGLIRGQSALDKFKSKYFGDE